MEQEHPPNWTGRESIQFLTQSPNRVAILEELNERGVADRYELEAAVDATRRTILRALTDLAECGYVQETADGYRLTALGGRVYRQFCEFVDGVSFDDDLEAFLSFVSDGTFPFAVDHLEDSEVTVVTDGGSYAPLDRLLALRAEATTIRELAPAVERQSIEQLAGRISDDEALSVTMGLSEAALETATTNEQYTDLHETVSEADAVDILVVPDGFDVGLCIADETVAIGVAGVEAHLRALCITDDPVVREWATEYFEERLEASKPVPV
jgi:predicted transcriptional regulator